LGLGAGLYSNWDLRVEYKLPPKGRLTDSVTVAA